MNGQDRSAEAEEMERERAALEDALKTREQPLTVEAIEQNPWHAVTRDLNPWPSAELSGEVVRVTDDLWARAVDWGNRAGTGGPLENAKDRELWFDVGDLAQARGERAAAAHEMTEARAAWREPEFSRSTISADPWTAVHLPVPEEAPALLLAEARMVASDLLLHARDGGPLEKPLVNATEFTRDQNIDAAAERIGVLDERIERARAEMPPLRALAFDDEVQEMQAARVPPAVDRGRLERLETEMQKILDLPANDHGERTIPPGFLDGAREALDPERSRYHGEFLSLEFQARKDSESLARTTEMMLGVVLGYFVDEPALTPEQARLANLAHAERAEAMEFEGARRESAAALDAVNAEIDRHRPHIAPEEVARPDAIYERYPGLTRDVDAEAERARGSSSERYAGLERDEGMEQDRARDMSRSL